MNNQAEYKIQATFVKAVRLKYHDKIIVFSDTAAHIGKTMQQQIRANALSSNIKQPDCFIAAPSGDYSGLFIEWKKETPFKKDGVTLKKNEHVEAQADGLARLRAAGYMAVFCWDVLEGLKILDNYLNNRAQ
jgi:hypothetical protein